MRGHNEVKASRSNGSIEQVWNRSGGPRGSPWEMVFHLRSYVEWQLTGNMKGERIFHQGISIHKGEWPGRVGNTEDYSRIFNLDKVDGEERTHLSERSPSAFCSWSHLDQDNCLEKRLLFMKLSVLRRTSIIFNSIHSLEYNHNSKWHLIEVCSNGHDFLKGISNNLVIG